MASNYLTTIPKLQGRENYQEWSFAMENFLLLEGINTCIKEDTTANATVSEKAKARIVLSIDPSLYVHVKEAKTAKEVWDRLKQLYEDTGFSRKISLLRHLISVRLEKCLSMTTTCHKL